MYTCLACKCVRLWHLGLLLRTARALSPSVTASHRDRTSRSIGRSTQLFCLVFFPISLGQRLEVLPFHYIRWRRTLRRIGGSYLSVPLSRKTKTLLNPWATFTATTRANEGTMASRSSTVVRNLLFPNYLDAATSLFLLLDLAKISRMVHGVLCLNRYLGTILIS